MFFNFNTWITQLLAASSIFFAMIISSVSIGWLYGILQRLGNFDSQPSNLCSDEEYRCIVLVVSYNLLMWGILAVKMITSSWWLGLIDEYSLVALTFLQIFFIVIITGNGSS